jgi:hypothetical protein
MKKLFAIVTWCLMLCWMVSCSRTPDQSGEKPAKIQRAKGIIRSSEKHSDNTEIHKAKAILLEVLTTDPTNMEANRMLSEIYFKQASALLDELTDEASLTELEMVQNKRVMFLQKALFHLQNINDTSALRKTIEKELYMTEE